MLSTAHRIKSIRVEERVVKTSKTNTCDDRLMMKGGGRKIHISSTISFVTMIFSGFGEDKLKRKKNVRGMKVDNKQEKCRRKLE